VKPDRNETPLRPQPTPSPGDARRRTMRLFFNPPGASPFDEGWRFRVFRIVLVASVVGLGLWSLRLMVKGTPLRHEIEAEEYRIEHLEQLGDEVLRVAFDVPDDPLSDVREEQFKARLERHAEEVRELGIVPAVHIGSGKGDTYTRSEIGLFLAALAEERHARHEYLHALQRESEDSWNGMIGLIIVLLLQALAALVLLDLNVRARRRISVLFHRATRDELTAVLNRRAIVETATKELDRSSREGKDLALFLVDLDWFKQVNDRLGHRAGDELLQEVAKRLKGALRPYDSVGRYGGDEFLLVLPGCDIEAARAICERVCVAMRKPFVLGKRNWAGSVSIGAVVALRGGAELTELMDSADAALYRTKARGRDGWTAVTHLSNVGGPAPADGIDLLSEEREPAASESRSSSLEGRD
jgi:diguanylate cyclase (GGDEF)-like protein